MHQFGDTGQIIKENLYVIVYRIRHSRVGSVMATWPERFNKTEERKLVRSLFVLSLCLNLLFIFVRRNFYFVETWENGEIAQHLVQGIGFSFSYFGNPVQPTSIMAPFYPYFLATVYSVFGVSPAAHLFVQIVQAVTQAGTVIVVFYISKELFGRSIAAISALLLAVFPDYLYGVTIVHQLTFTTFGVAVLLLSLLRLRSDPSVRRGILSGAILGFTALVFPSVLFFSPFIAGWLLLELEGEYNWRFATTVVTAITVVAVVFVLPWSIRNYLVHDQLVLVKMNGFNFWRGNTPPAIYSGGANDLSMLGETTRKRLRNLTEAEGNGLLQAIAIEYVLGHPAAFAAAIVRRMINFWWFPPAAEQSQVGMLRRIVYTPVLLTGVCGIALSRWNRRELVPIYLLFVAFTVGYGLFFIRPRYRTPTTQPYLILFSAYFLYYSMRRVTEDYRNYTRERLYNAYVSRSSR